jgi:hypothetical protein
MRADVVVAMAVMSTLAVARALCPDQSALLVNPSDPAASGPYSVRDCTPNLSHQCTELLSLIHSLLNMQVNSEHCCPSWGTADEHCMRFCVRLPGQTHDVLHTNALVHASVGQRSKRQLHIRNTEDVHESTS